ncbi:MAG TPA: ergothioneine biosynthesis glutamate--cysteine ligase EgtA [Streptosporangiaceae bacterium]|nr:ergothioneine biosynthesis glutamate--cysteine ligase EgtA [Streptosporangiaceae bacterium]
MKTMRDTAPCPPGDSEPLSEEDAEEHVHGICFKTGPPARLGVELEWLVHDGRDPALPVDQQRVTAALAGLDVPGALPGRGRLTTEPGGQVEISSAPVVGLAACIARASDDLTALRRAFQPGGLALAGMGLDPLRSPRRVLDQPRYAAMEEFFNRDGPWGRFMMCSTASVQVCVDAGQEGTGPDSLTRRWRLLHTLGPVLVAAFANSPICEGRATGWKSTRQAIWAQLDPGRTRPPAHAQPTSAASNGNGRTGLDGEADHRAAWVDYALGAEVMCMRRAAPRPWSAPAGLTFRDWLRGAGERPPTLGDLDYHLSTLFPPVRPRGHLEVRVIDAQPGDGWVVPAAVLDALLRDETAGDEALAAAQPLWGPALAGNGSVPGHAGWWDGRNPWLRAARFGPADRLISAAATNCFGAAESALGRLDAPPDVRQAVTTFAERYVARSRCPADDRLDEARRGEGGPAQATVYATQSLQPEE